MNDGNYTLTFARDADGGPAHILYMLRDYIVVLKKNGAPIGGAEAWTIRDIDPDTNTVTVCPFEGNDPYQQTGPLVRFVIGKEFDEVEYQ